MINHSFLLYNNYSNRLLDSRFPSHSDMFQPKILIDILVWPTISPTYKSRPLFHNFNKMV